MIPSAPCTVYPVYTYTSPVRAREARTRGCCLYKSCVETKLYYVPVETHLERNEAARLARVGLGFGAAAAASLRSGGGTGTTLGGAL